MKEHDLYDFIKGKVEMADYCSSNYWKWEDQVRIVLQDEGHHVSKFFTIDGDSFGPLVRGVYIDKRLYTYG